MLDSLAPARRRLALGVVALAVALVVAVVAVVFGHRAPQVRPVAQDAQPPVLLVPGYGGSTGDLAVLAAALERSGRTVRVVSLGNRSQGDLHGQADLVDRAVRAARASTGSASVDLVGYSAGG